MRRTPSSDQPDFFSRQTAAPPGNASPGKLPEQEATTAAPSNVVYFKTATRPPPSPPQPEPAEPPMRVLESAREPRSSDPQFRCDVFTKSGDRDHFEPAYETEWGVEPATLYRAHPLRKGPHRCWGRGVAFRCGRWVCTAHAKATKKALDFHCGNRFEAFAEVTAQWDGF